MAATVPEAMTRNKINLTMPLLFSVVIIVLDYIVGERGFFFL